MGMPFLLPALLLTGLTHAQVCPNSYHMDIAWIDYTRTIFEEVFIPNGSIGTYLPMYRGGNS